MVGEANAPAVVAGAPEGISRHRRDTPAEIAYALGTVA